MGVGCCCLGFLSGCPVINASWISSSTRSSAASAGGSAAADACRRRQGGTILCAVAGSYDGPSTSGAIEGVGRPSILRQPLGWAFSAQMATDRHISRKRDGNHINRNVVAAMPPNVRRAMPRLLVSTGDPQGVSLGGGTPTSPEQASGLITNHISVIPDSPEQAIGLIAIYSAMPTQPPHTATRGYYYAYE